MLQNFARFWCLFRSVMRLRSTLVPFYPGVSVSLFFLFLDFIAINDCVFNNKTVILLGLARHQIIITISALRASLYANLCVPTRVYDVEGGAIFSKNSTFVFFDGYTWTPRSRSPFLIMAPVMRLT